MTEKPGPRTAATQTKASEFGLLQKVARKLGQTLGDLSVLPKPRAVQSRSWQRDIDRWFAAQIAPHERGFLSLARRLSPDMETARDLVHDAYAEVLSDEKWQSITHPRAYVRRTIYNIGLNRLKRSRIVTMQQLAKVETVTYADLAPDAFDALSSRQELELVMAALRKLPTRSRNAVIMRRLEGLGPTAIAAEMGISVSTVETHLANGLALLADLLDISETGGVDRVVRRQTQRRQERPAQPDADA